ncbi:MAG: outer membrane lipoprotein-sorting protein, partial [Gammaproteobacteria bacterium]|nr:outer membrane lipoprotein-sorting protein [Gammaproteobacteria bacterium]
MNTRKTLALITLTSLINMPFSVTLADSEFARKIMEDVHARNDGESMSSILKMTLIDKRGDQRTKTIQSFRLDLEKDTRAMMFFISPADVAGTGFMTYDYDSPHKKDDQWLYLPALNKTKRIAAADKSGSFMGSDFNFSDMGKANLDDYDFSLKKEVEVRDKKVWLIEALPRSTEIIDETGYSKTLLFVQQDNHMVIRAVKWVSGGSRIKYMDVPKVA